MNAVDIFQWVASQFNRKNFNIVLILAVFFVYYNKSEQQMAAMEKRQEQRNEELKQEFRDCNVGREDCEDKYEELVTFIQQYIIDSKKNN